MSSVVNDRAAGAMLGAACGAALATGFAAARTGDQALAAPILQAAAAGESLTGEAAQDRIVAAWVGLLQEGLDVAARTEAALSGLREPTALAARAAARTLQARRGDAADAGALLRTAPVALASAQTASTTALVRAATQLAALTHADPTGAEACVLLSGAIHAAIRTGELDLRGALVLLPAASRAAWTARVDEAEAEAEAASPRASPEDGGPVGVLLAAWAAIARTPVPEQLPGRHLRLALEAVGDDPEVAAVAGALLGARWGASAVPAEWRRALDGGPGLPADDLARDAVLAANGGLGDGTGWPAVDRVRPSGSRVLVPHPFDEGVLLGSLAALDDLPGDVDAVVSLCRVGRRQTDREQVGFWLVDQPGRNPNLDLVLLDAAATVAALRAEGRRVLLHCAEGRSRTPAVAAVYAAVHLGIPAARALAEVTAALPAGAPAPFLQEAVLRIGERVAPEHPRPLLYVALDALLDTRSGLDRLPAAARAEYAGRETAAPGVVALMDALPGAVEGFRRLAEDYDASLLVSTPWHDPTAWQLRLEWVQRHFGTAEVDAAGVRNPAFERLVVADPRHLGRGAVLVGDRDLPGADRFDGEWIPFGTAPFDGWDAVLAHLLAPERIGGGRPASRSGRSRDRTAGRPALTGWLLESLRAHGGSASVVRVTRDVWDRHEEELRRSGDLFSTWQHDLRRVAATLREEGRLAPSDGDQGIWRLAR